LTPEAQAAKAHRRKLEATLSSTPTPEAKRAYNVACRKSNKLIKSSRRVHHTTRLTESSSDTRKLWGVLRSILHPTRDPQITDPGWAQAISQCFIDKVRNVGLSVEAEVSERDSCELNLLGLDHPPPAAFPKS